MDNGQDIETLLTEIALGTKAKVLKANPRKPHSLLINNKTEKVVIDAVALTLSIEEKLFGIALASELKFE